MTRERRWLSTMPVLLVVVALPCGAASAADKTKVDGATKQVEQGRQADRPGPGRSGIQGNVHRRRPHGRRGRQVQRRERQGALQRQEVARGSSRAGSHADQRDAGQEQRSADRAGHRRRPDPHVHSIAGPDADPGPRGARHIAAIHSDGESSSPARPNATTRRPTFRMTIWEHRRARAAGSGIRPEMYTTYCGPPMQTGTFHAHRRAGRRRCRVPTQASRRAAPEHHVQRVDAHEQPEGQHRRTARQADEQRHAQSESDEV